MIYELQSAMNYIQTGMREQSNKDKALNFLHSEIDELKEMISKGRLSTSAS
jgi:hypothetical protein